MTDTKREQPDRRRVQRGGRRKTDVRMLTPELQAEAKQYAAELERCLASLKAALDDDDLVSARETLRTLTRAGDALQLVLSKGKSAKT